MPLNTAVYKDVTSYRVVEGYHHGRETGCLHLEGIQSETFYSKEEGSIFLQNAGRPTYLPK